MRLACFGLMLLVFLIAVLLYMWILGVTGNICNEIAKEKGAISQDFLRCLIGWVMLFIVLTVLLLYIVILVACSVDATSQPSPLLPPTWKY